MARHLQVEIEKLKNKLLGLSLIVEESVQIAVRAVGERNIELSKSVIKNCRR